MSNVNLEYIKKDILEAIKTREIFSARYKRKIESWFGNDLLEELLDKEYFSKNYSLIKDNKKGYDYNFDESLIRFFILNTIANLTVKGFSDRFSYIKTMKKSNLISRYKRTKTGFLLFDANKTPIKIELISKRYPETLIHFPQLEDFCARERECHVNSILLSPHIPSEKVDVVTGYVDSINGSRDILHSWIESQHNGSEYVVDFNLNAIFSKEDYYKIRQAQPLSVISRDELVDFLKFGESYMTDEQKEVLSCLGLKAQLLFFHDIYKILKEEQLNKSNSQPGDD